MAEPPDALKNALAAAGLDSDNEKASDREPASGSEMRSQVAVSGSESQVVASGSERPATSASGTEASDREKRSIAAQSSAAESKRSGVSAASSRASVAILEPEVDAEFDRAP